MYRLAVVVSHPIQYYAPWYRALTKVVDLHVFYAYHPTPQQQADAGFGVPFDWDLPLLEGYEHTFLNNRSRHPDVLHFSGCDTPEIADVIRRDRFDAVLVNGWNLRTYWQAERAAKRAGIPVLVRGDSRFQTRQRTAVRLAKEWIYPVMLRRFDAFLTVGVRNTEYLRHYGVPPDKIFRVPHAVDNDFFASRTDGARKGPDPRKRFGLSDAATVFLFAGKFVDFKRPGDLLAAAERASDLQVLMVGDGPLRASLESAALEKRVSCVFTGFLNQGEISAAFAAADAIVLLSTDQETWGLIVNEAMAAGLPAIVSDQAGCAPDLIVEGKTGFTYPCANVPALRDQLRQLSSHRELLPQMSREARNHIAGFSYSSGLDAVIAALDFVTSRGKTAPA